MDETLRVAALQLPHGDHLPAILDHARDALRRAAEGGARLALLPEYFFATPGGGPDVAARQAEALHAFLRGASADLGLAVGGNLIEARAGALVNLGVVYEAGRLALAQPKVHPMPREAAAGLVPGGPLRAGPVLGRPTGLLVCADVLYPEAARVLALQGAQLLLNPVMSPYREQDVTKAARDALFIARAYDSGAFLVKAGGFRVPGGGFPGVAGRSLVAAPWGLLARYRDDFTEEILFADLDFAQLGRFRKAQEAFPARQPEAYRELLGT